jgi:hypothetical protein
LAMKSGRTARSSSVLRTTTTSFPMTSRTSPDDLPRQPLAGAPHLRGALIRPRNPGASVVVGIDCHHFEVPLFAEPCSILRSS